VLAQCPHCRTVFAVSGDHLEAAGGRVRCGHCLKPFNANLHVVEDLPPSSEAPDAGEPAPALSDTLRQVAALPEPRPAPRLEAEPTPEPVASEARAGAQPQVSPETGPASPLPAARERAAVPEVLAADAAAMMTARTPWYLRAGQGAALLVLLVLGLAQYAWFMPADLLQRFPQARPWLQQAFRSAGRELAVPRDLSRIRLMSRDVRVHQGYANVLQVNAKLVNQALTQQPYPGLRLTLFDVTGAVVAARTFGPKEYLKDSVATTKGMQPGVPLQIHLDIVSPDAAAVSYEFQFL
jgi:predicted Zn finger-like uncharacterized protein